MTQQHPRTTVRMIRSMVAGVAIAEAMEEATEEAIAAEIK
jgi:hypothetical protein